MSRAAIKSLISLLLSVAVAYSPTLVAHGTVNLHSSASPVNPDEYPVVIQKLQSKDGQEFYAMTASVSPEQEAQVVMDLAKRNADSTLFGLNNMSDPAWVAAIESDNLKNLQTVLLADANHAPILTEISLEQKQKVLRKIQEINEFCKAKKEGLLTAIFGASLMTGFAYYTSSSVSAAAAVLSTYFVWNAFLATHADQWRKLMKKGGDGMTYLGSLITKLFSYNPSGKLRKALDTVGQFGTSFAANALVAGTVLWGAGELSLEKALIFGAMFNTNIWDTTAFRKYESGAWSEKKLNGYFRLQILSGPFLEFFSYFKDRIDHAVPVMANVNSDAMLLYGVLLGLTYAVLGEDVEKAMQERQKNGESHFSWSQWMKSWFTRAKPASGCESLLSRAVAEDIQ